MVRARLLARFALTLMVVLSLSAGLAWSAETPSAKHKAKPTQTTPQSNSGEKTITEAQVPAPVISAFTKAHPEATPRVYTQKTKNGTVHYDIANTDKNGQVTRHSVYTSTGRMIEVDETITAADLPAAVQATINAQYSGQKILLSQRITRQKATEYGVTVSGTSHLAHVILDTKGTVLRTEAESHVGIEAATPPTPGSAPVAPVPAGNGKP